MAGVCSFPLVDHAYVMCLVSSYNTAICRPLASRPPRALFDDVAGVSRHEDPLVDRGGSECCQFYVGPDLDLQIR